MAVTAAPSGYPIAGERALSLLNDLDPSPEAAAAVAAAVVYRAMMAAAAAPAPESAPMPLEPRPRSTRQIRWEYLPVIGIVPSTLRVIFSVITLIGKTLSFIFSPLTFNQYKMQMTLEGRKIAKHTLNIATAGIYLFATEPRSARLF